MSIVAQISWIGDNVKGHSIESGLIDDTEGFGAYDSLLSSESLGNRIIDIGGGLYDYNTAYVAQKYLNECLVYDPYKRSVSHNRKVLQCRPYDAAVSFSILNVINTSKARLAHIRLCQQMIKFGGKAAFKVWPGDGSGIGKVTASGYQCNRPIETYLQEIVMIFGRQNVRFDKHLKQIVCRNAIDRYPSGSVSL